MVWWINAGIHCKYLTLTFMVMVMVGFDLHVPVK